MKKLIKSALSGSALLLALSIAAPAQQANMTFFVTSAGPGKGADLGGLEGADRHCQTLAQAAGAGGKTWRAYLSTQGAGAVMMGHSDRTGLDDSAPAKSWNSSHPSQGPGGGCAQTDLRSTGGAGLLYCFATN